MSAFRDWRLPIGLAVVGVAALVVWVPQWAEVAVLVALLFVVMGVVGTAVARESDRRWLPSLLMVAFAVKLLAGWLRHFMVVSVYEVGDAVSYHAHATQLVNAWRALEIPITEGASVGTRFVRVVTSLLYAPYVPSMLTGFLLFATLAFVGQLFFYLAFRRDVADSRLRLYAIAVFFLPTLVFWPASIGKDSLMVLGLGAAVYGASGLWKSFRVGPLLLLTGGVSLTAVIRPHIAALLLASVCLTLLVMRPKHGHFRMRRLLLLGMIGAAFLFAATLAADELGILEEGGIDPFVSEVERRTAQGGSEIEGGGAISSPAELPGGIITVLFRPFPHEAHNPQALLASLEGIFLMGLLIWRLPTMGRNLRHLRDNPHLLFALFYTVGFAIGFSAILNFGILARQRTQVLAFLLALIVGLGWDPEPADHSGSAGPLRADDLVRT